MANYTSNFNNPYPNGWQDLPSEETPINANALQKHTDTLSAIDTFLNGTEQNAQVNKIEKITVDGQEQTITNKTVNLPSGTKDYEALENLPQINGVTLSGDKSAADLSLASEEEISAITNDLSHLKSGGKNLLNCSDIATHTAVGITVTPHFTSGAVDYINVNGTATGLLLDRNTKHTLKANVPIILTGGTSAVQLSLRDYSGNTVYANQNVEYTPTTDIEAYLFIRVSNGATVSNVKVYPMIRLATDTDGTYEPYYKGTVELTSDLDSLPIIKFGKANVNVSTTGFAETTITIEGNLKPKCVVITPLLSSSPNSVGVLVKELGTDNFITRGYCSTQSITTIVCSYIAICEP